MFRGFYLWLSIISGVVFIIYMGLALERELRPEWESYQLEYRDILVGNATDDDTIKKAKSLKLGMEQIYIAALGKTDRCTNCHMGVDNPLMADEKLPFKTHGGDFLKQHPVAQYGCTVCHKGQGRATNKKEAHGTGRDTHWDYPILPFEYMESSCASCHDFNYLEENGFHRVATGEKIFRETGCKGCHKLDGVGGILGKSLDGVGSQPIAYFPMVHVEGDKTVYSWMKEHFDDPRNLVIDSQMLSNLSDEEANLVTTYILSLQSEEIHKSYRRIDRLMDRDRSTPSKISDDEGETLYKTYCIACHTTGRESIYDETFKRTIPAIMNPAFLRAADDKLLKTVISEGRADTQMTSWKKDAAGLSDGDLDKIIKYLTKDRPETRPAPFAFAEFDANIKYGEDLYRVRCMGCHGEKGQGGVGLNLKNPVVQKFDPEFLAITVRDGRDGTHMVAFGKDGVGFADQDVADVISYVKTFGNKR